eukprot:SAG11_NODE_24794_length_368_cov_0.598513_1_plen_44_part_10
MALESSKPTEWLTDMHRVIWPGGGGGAEILHRVLKIKLLMKRKY